MHPPLFTPVAKTLFCLKEHGRSNGRIAIGAKAELQPVQRMIQTVIDQIKVRRIVVHRIQIIFWINVRCQMVTGSDQKLLRLRTVQTEFLLNPQECFTLCPYAMP